MYFDDSPADEPRAARLRQDPRGPAQTPFAVMWREWRHLLRCLLWRTRAEWTGLRRAATGRLNRGPRYAPSAPASASKSSATTSNSPSAQGSMLPPKPRSSGRAT